MYSIASKTLKRYVLMLSLLVAIAVVEAASSMTRLWRQARLWDMLDVGMVIILIASVLGVFWRFISTFDEDPGPEECRKLILPAWRIAALGTFAALLAVRLVR